MVQPVTPRRKGTTVIAHQSTFQPGVEALEGRCVPTTAKLLNGVLFITGTPRFDNIHVGLAGPKIRVNGVHQTFRAKAVREIVIDTRGGHDAITLAPRLMMPVVRIDPGSVTILRGFGNATTLNGSGNAATTSSSTTTTTTVTSSGTTTVTSSSTTTTVTSSGTTTPTGPGNAITPADTGATTTPTDAGTDSIQQTLDYVNQIYADQKALDDYFKSIQETLDYVNQIYQNLQQLYDYLNSIQQTLDYVNQIYQDQQALNDYLNSIWLSS
jgi:hypothetical protein